MYIKEETSQGVVYLEFKNVKGLGLNLSGGIDSATLLYVVCKSMTEQNEQFPIYCITACNSTDIYGAYHSGLVFNFIKRRFTKLDLHHIVDYSMMTGKFKIDRKNKIIKKLYSENKINAYTEGITKNPLSNDFNFINPQEKYTPPEDKRDKEIESITKFNMLTRYRPWSNIDKKGINEIASNNGIKHKLLLITRSCTHKKIHKCNKCWWCQERLWAFPEEKRSRIQRILK